MKRALVWVVCLAACAVPELDRAGNIRCGVATEPNGGCPDGYACNADRCCPVGATGCPTLPPACEGHRVAPYPAASPPAECSTAPVVGRACRLAVNPCGTGLLCAETADLPGGYCSLIGCGGSLPAARALRTTCEGAGGVCLGGYGIGSGGACAMRCSLPAGETFGRCRADQPGRYICVRVTNTQINETLCIPDCVANPSMCGSGMCNARTHLCEGATP